MTLRAILGFLLLMMTATAGEVAGPFVDTVGVRTRVGKDLNSLVLTFLRSMPAGGRYSVDSRANTVLEAAIRLNGRSLALNPNLACPSYCSGATYLVFLRTINYLVTSGALPLDDAALAQLLVKGQPDGKGVWGRWNANGPGTARLFHELGLGRNFTSFQAARPGDFMKIFWTSEVGRSERGHSVIFLGTESVDGIEHVRYWSSNKPAGYGEQVVPRAQIAQAIFSRLETPENLRRVGRLPETDPYLGKLLSVRSSFAEAKKKCGCDS